MPIRGLITTESSGVVRLGKTVVPERVAYVIDGREASPSLRIEFVMRDGNPVCTSVHVEANPDGRGVLTGDLTTIPSLKALAVDVFTAMSSGTMSANEEAALEGLDVAARIRAKARAQFAASTDPDARRAAASEIRTDAELQDVARVYRENIDGHPRKAVQDVFGWTPRTASRRVERARDKGYLPKTTRGRKNA